MEKSADPFISHYEKLFLVHQEIGQRLFNRLDLIKINSKKILDIGCGTGSFSYQLAKRYPHSKVIGLDASSTLITLASKYSSSNLCYIIEPLPTISLADHSIDLVFSNLSFQNYDLQKIIKECKRLLKPEGLLLFSTLGPDTFYEWRSALKKIEKKCNLPIFIDMHYIGDNLNEQQFSDAVMDKEYISLTFTEEEDLIEYLKITEEYILKKTSQENFSPKDKFFIEKYRDFFTEENSLPVTYEVIYGHAWQKDFTSQQTIDDNGLVKVPLKFLGTKR